MQARQAGVIKLFAFGRCDNVLREKHWRYHKREQMSPNGRSRPSKSRAGAPVLERVQSLPYFGISVVSIHSRGKYRPSNGHIKRVASEPGMPSELAEACAVCSAPAVCAVYTKYYICDETFTLLLPASQHAFFLIATDRVRRATTRCCCTAV